MAKENGIPVEPSVVLNSKPLFRFSQSPELSHLEQYLYAYPYKTYNEKTKDISLFSSVNIFAEVEACARDIVRLCRTGECATGRLPLLPETLTAMKSLSKLFFRIRNSMLY